MTKPAQQIPDGWKMMRFDEYVNLLYGSNLPKDKREDGPIPVYGSNGITDYHSEPLVKGPGIIIGRKGSIGLVHWSNQDFWPIDTTYYVVDDNNKNLRWAYYKLQTLGLEKMNTASGIPGLNRNEVYSLKIAIPPSSEQNRIAAILSKVDEEIEKVERIIEQTEKLKKGLVKALFQNQTHSAKYKISDIAEVASSKRVMVSDYVEEGIPFYRSTEIIKKSKNIPVTDQLYISYEKFNSFKERFGAPEKGDLIITAVGTIGDVYLVQNETFYFKDGNSVWIRRLKNFVLHEYLKMILASSFYKDKLNKISGGSSQKALTIKKLESVEVPIPTIPEQKRLISILSSIDKKILIYKKQRFKFKKLKKGLMNDLLSGRKRIL